MPRASPLTQILHTQTREELDAIRRELAPRVSTKGSKENYVKRLRSSLKNSIDKGEIDYGDLLEVIEADNRKYVSTRIRNRVQDTVFSWSANHGHSGRIREENLTVELYQALRYKFDDEEIEVRDEVLIGGGHRPDLLLEDHRDRTHLIEVKTPSSIGTLLNQLNKYQNEVSCHKVYVCYVTDRQYKLRGNDQSINGTLSAAERHHDADIIQKGPDDFQES